MMKRLLTALIVFLTTSCLTRTGVKISQQRNCFNKTSQLEIFTLECLKRRSPGETDCFEAAQEIYCPKEKFFTQYKWTYLPWPNYQEGITQPCSEAVTGLEMRLCHSNIDGTLRVEE